MGKKKKRDPHIDELIAELQHRAAENQRKRFGILDAADDVDHAIGAIEGMMVCASAVPRGDLNDLNPNNMAALLRIIREHYQRERINWN